MCPKNTSLPKAYCAHCQGTERGTPNNPRFSLKEYYFNGYPVVEVLKDGGQVVWSDSHFRFGIRKAQMLVACVVLFREFWRSSDERKLAFKPRLVEDQRQGLRIQIYVEMLPDVETSDGRPIDRPYLHLQALPPDEDHIGLGSMKCRAICEVQDDLRRWLHGQGVAYEWVKEKGAAGAPTQRQTPRPSSFFWGYCPLVEGVLAGVLSMVVSP